MEELRDKLEDFLSERLYQVIISNPRKRDGALKVKIRPIMIKGKLYFQESVSRGTQVFHENYEKDGMLERLLDYMREEFRQLEAQSMDGRIHVLISKKGKVTIKLQKAAVQASSIMPDMSHNRTKQYILKEGVPVPFLIDLGVQTRDGIIIKSKYNKFKQINRYLEFVEDILPVLSQKETVHIIDFGCGKSYLTFALYYYLHELKRMEVRITGLDLKQMLLISVTVWHSNMDMMIFSFTREISAPFREQIRWIWWLLSMPVILLRIMRSKRQWTGMPG